MTTHLQIVDSIAHAECSECELEHSKTSQGTCYGVMPASWQHGGLMLVGEGPGFTEMKTREPFVGRAGSLLSGLLKAANIQRDECVITNATSCAPPPTGDGSFADRFPNAIRACLPRLEYEIALTRPRVIVALGAAALLALTGREEETAVRLGFPCATCDPTGPTPAVKRAKSCPECLGLKTRVHVRTDLKSEHSISWVAGAVIPAQGWLQAYGVKYVVATYHPSYLLRKAETAAQKAMAGQFVAPAVVAHLRKAHRLLKRDAQWSLTPIVSDLPEDVDAFTADPDPNFPWAIDIETDAKDPYEVTHIKCIGVGRADRPEVYVFDTSASAPDSPLVQALCRFLADPLRPKVLQNRVYDEVVIDRVWGCVTKGTVGDTMLAHHALFPDELHNLHQIAFRYTDTAPWKPPKNRNGMQVFASDEEFWLYNARDVRATALAWQELRDEMRAEGVTQIHEMDLRMSTIAMDMQMVGMPLDRAALKDLGEEKTTSAIMALDSMRDVAGPEFNPASVPQLQKVLFERLGLHTGVKTATGLSGTSRSALRHLLDHTFVRSLFDWRDARKIVGTYVEPYLALGTDRIHPIWKCHGTHTGRWSVNPNLQAWPHDLRAVVRAPDGFKIVGADFAALEYRILAALCGDEQMIAIIERADESKKLDPYYDPHAYVASVAFGVAYTGADPATPDGAKRRKALREIAKRVVYAISYGAGARKILDSIMSDEDYTGPPLTLDMVQRVVDAFFRAFARVRPYMNNAIDNARKTQQVRSAILGRKRDFPLGDVDATVAQNHPIQSTAADIVDAALDRLYRRLAAEVPGAAIIAQVHDAIYVETPEFCSIEEATRAEVARERGETYVSQADRVATMLEECMRTKLSLVPGAPEVSFTATAKVGDTWAAVS